MKGPKTETIVGNFRFTLRSTGESSARFGVCEICSEHCSEVFIQTVAAGYWDEEEKWCWTYFGIKRATLFGHEACLKRLQNGRVEMSEPPLL